MTKDQLVNLLELYLNDSGRWFEFVDYVESMGYNMEEIGFHKE